MRHRALLWALLALATAIPVSAQSIDYRTSMVDEDARNACGPIALSAALRLLGHTVSLDQATAACNWSGDRIAIGQLRDAALSFEGVRCDAIRLSPAELATRIDGATSVAILAVRKRSDEVDHVLVALRVKDDTVQIFDYPELDFDLPLEDLYDVWDGTALLLTNEPGRLRRSVAAMPITASLLAGGLVLGLFLRPRRTEETTP